LVSTEEVALTAFTIYSLHISGLWIVKGELTADTSSEATSKARALGWLSPDDIRLTACPIGKIDSPEYAALTF